QGHLLRGCDEPDPRRPRVRLFATTHDGGRRLLSPRRDQHDGNGKLRKGERDKGQGTSTEETENSGVKKVPIEGSIDLHTFHPRDIKSVVEEYVNAAHEAGFREVRLIHGRGRGVQRGVVQAALEKHLLVESFDDAPESHLGATVAVLKA